MLEGIQVYTFKNDMLVSVLDSLGRIELVFHPESTTGPTTPGLNPRPRNRTSSPNGDLISRARQAW